MNKRYLEKSKLENVLSIVKNKVPNKSDKMNQITNENTIQMWNDLNYVPTTSTNGVDILLPNGATQINRPATRILSLDYPADTGIGSLTYDDINTKYPDRIFHIDYIFLDKNKDGVGEWSNEFFAGRYKLFAKLRPTDITIEFEITEKDIQNMYQNNAPFIIDLRNEY